MGLRNTNHSVELPGTLQGHLLPRLTNENQSLHAAVAPAEAGSLKATNTRRPGILPPESQALCLARNPQPDIHQDPLLPKRTSLSLPGIRRGTPLSNPFYPGFLIRAMGQGTRQDHRTPKKIKWSAPGTLQVTHSKSNFPFPDYSAKIPVPGIPPDRHLPKKTKWSARDTPPEGISGPRKSQ